jgi:hypothetical protein
VDIENPGDLPKRHDGDTGRFQAGGQRSCPEQAIDQHLMAGTVLRQRKIDGQPLQSSQFQVFD